MKIYLNLVNEHGQDLLTGYKSNTLKSSYRKVKANGKEVVFWTGKCPRIPKKSVLARRAKKEGVDRVVILCPPTMKHLMTWTFDVKKNGLEEVAQKAFIVE
jgi:hypothetical protein